MSDLARFFPQFLWVVRDFGVRLERNGRRIAAREYLEDALRPEEGLSEAVEAKNAVRTLLRTYFPERDCMTLVRPVSEEEKLAHLAEQPWEELRPEFRSQMEALRRKVLGGARPKTMFGRALTGPMLASLAEAYVTALNSGETPTISTAWDRVVERQAQEALEKGVGRYASVMQSMLSLRALRASVPKDAAGTAREEVARSGVAARAQAPDAVVVSDEALWQCHADAATAARAEFARHAVGGSGGDGEEGDDAGASHPTGRLEAAVLDQLLHARRANAEASRRVADAVLRALDASILRPAVVDAVRRALESGSSQKAGVQKTAAPPTTTPKPPRRVRDSDEEDEDEEEDGSDLEDDKKGAATTTTTTTTTTAFEDESEGLAKARSFSLTTVASAYRAAAEQMRDALHAAACGPEAEVVYGEFLATSGARRLMEACEVAQDAWTALERAMRRDVEGARRAQAAEASRAQAARDTLTAERASFERAIQDAARASAAERERLSAELEARKEETFRLVSRVDSLVATFDRRMTAAEDRADSAEERLRLASDAYAADLAQRLDVAEKLAAAEGVAAEARAKADELTRVAQVADERTRAAENETVRLREQTELLYEAVRAAKDELRAKADEKEELEYEWAVSKAKVAEAESLRMQIEADHTTLVLVAEAMKNKLRDLRADASFSRTLDRIERMAFDALGTDAAHKMPRAGGAAGDA
jgi:Guanylate-binding protein, N-terminal domain/Guanylate-binding protein, C-terminal domain